MELYNFSKAMIARPQNHYDRYHAHVYFGADTVEQAMDDVLTRRVQGKVVLRVVNESSAAVLPKEQ